MFSNACVGDALHKQFMDNIDAPSMRPEPFESSFHLAADAMRILRHTPEGCDLVVRIVLLSMPRAGEPWGKCALRTKGLPLLKSDALCREPKSSS